MATTGQYVNDDDTVSLVSIIECEYSETLSVCGSDIVSEPEDMLEGQPIHSLNKPINTCEDQPSGSIIQVRKEQLSFDRTVLSHLTTNLCLHRTGSMSSRMMISSMTSMITKI